MMEVLMGNYLKMIDKQRILALLDLGWSYRKIQRETGVRRETISGYDPRHASKAAKVSTGETAKPARVSPGSSVEPYRKEVEAALAKGLSAQRIWQDLRADYGFGYNYASVKRFVYRLKKTHREVADVMEHLPGKEAQVDFFEGPPTLDSDTGKWRRPWIFRMTLSCSRHGYEEALWHQDQAHFLRAHEHAFESFGGVPEVVRQDNLKAAIVRACLYDPDVSELYEALAKHYGFVPLPSRPRHPQENGVEERSGGYVKDNALKGKHFNSLEELNDYLARWNRTIARLRIHGTTRKQVYTHFLEMEKPLLNPLPSERFALFEIGTCTVHPDGHIQVEGAYYSVPHILVGQEVKVHWDEHLVRVYARGRSVAVHSRHPAGAFATQKEHRPEHKPAREEAYVANLLSKAEHIGPHALSWAKAACDERGVRAYRLLQGMISLTRSLPRERVNWACGLALQNRLFRYKILRRLAEKETASQLSLFIQHHEIIRDLREYAEEVKL
jgi:transposase